MLPLVYAPVKGGGSGLPAGIVDIDGLFQDATVSDKSHQDALDHIAYTCGPGHRAVRSNSYNRYQGWRYSALSG